MGHDHWRDALMQAAPCTREPESVDAEDKRYILCTPGATGKPKGIAGRLSETQRDGVG